MGINWQMGVSDPMQGINTGLANLGQALQYQKQQERQAAQDTRQNTLADLQMQQSTAAIADTEAKQKGLQSAYGVDSPQAAYEAQFKASQQAEQQKRGGEKSKMALDTFKQVSDAVKGGTISPEVGGDLYHNMLKMNGMNLDDSGVKMTFKSDGGYFSGPVKPSHLFMVNGKATPFGSDGIIENAKITGLSPEGEPIFEMTQHTKFKEAQKPLASDHQVQELPSADGKTAQKMQFNPATQRYDIPVGQPYTVKSQVPSVNVKVPAPGRLVQAFDKETRDLVYVGADDVKANPSRYAPAGAQMKTNQQQTLIEDIRGTLNNTMSSLDKMKPFDNTQQAQIALMLKDRDPRSAVSKFMGSKIGQTLSPEQVDYITDLAVLKENILAMRTLLGGGQGSQDQRAAIEATIPGAIQPNKEFAKVQLTKALRTLDRLERGTANGSLRPEKGAEVPTPRGKGIKSAKDPLGIL